MTAELTIELPREWRTAPFRMGFVDVVAEVKLPSGRLAVVVLALLKDGTNVLAMTWDRGTRLARVSPDTDWALEERFTGRPPGPGEGALVRAWRHGIESVIRAGKDAEAEMAEPGWEPSPAVFVMNEPGAMDVAYASYCERGVGPALTRDEFEHAIGVLVRQELLGDG